MGAGSQPDGFDPRIVHAWQPQEGSLTDEKRLTQTRTVFEEKGRREI